MFNKPTFGSNTSGFGSFNSGATTAASPFGGFKPAANTSAFGAPPTFGSAATQPATGGLFGASNTSTGLFGSTTSTAAPAFGTASTGFGGFGAGTSSGGLFGSNTTSTGLFGNTQNTSAFGAKPAGGFGFGGTTTTGTTGGGLFGATPAASGGLFGQQPNTLGGGLFSSNTSTFGQQQQATGTAHVKYSPLVGTDVVVKSGQSQSVNIKHHCITCMKEYENKSLEELRLEDYTAGRKGSSNAGVFGFQQTEQKPLFGGTTAFGQPATTTASNVFGASSLGTSAGFGQTNTFSFGNNTQNAANTSGGLFGAAKPAFGATNTTGTGLFGATTTQAPSFGTSSAPSFGFGSNTQNQTGGLFGAKPATTGFGTTPASTGFGGFGTGGGMFGAKPQQTTAPTFGSTTPAFGTLGSGGFGTSTAGGGMFGGSTFGKPATTQSAFGFNAPNTQLGGGLGGGLGSNTFQSKPAAPTFGNLGGSLFQTPNTNTFQTGLDSGLGGGSMFGSSALGSSGLGLGALGGSAAQNNANLSGASAAGNVHEQILNLVARPYGDSPLFKDISNDTSTSTEALKPTNPAAMKAVLDSANNYRMTNSSARLKLHHNDKKSLFDGLEESDASLEDKLSLKPSRKRLVLRPKSNSELGDSTDGNVRNRSIEEPQSNVNVNGVHTEADGEAASNKSAADEDRLREIRDNSNLADNHNLETTSDRHGSWLNASKHQWSAEKEKQIGNEPTPRLYPNLDKEVPIHISERRASWLTTKPLRKPLSNNPESAENSVRELGVRPPDHSQDKENVDTFSVSTEEEHVLPRPMPPHPTGVKLTRPGYYTIPALDDMIKYMRPDGSCVVPHLTIGRKNYGNVYYDCEIDVAGLDLDALVHFLNKEVTIYPDDSDKPPVGQGLNRRAIVTLDRIWPRDKTEKRPITDPDRLLAMDYEGKLRRVCDKHDTKFIEYRPQTGSWVFRVEHFSKYSLTDSDEEDEITPEVLKRQLVNQQLQKSAPIAPPKPVQTPGLGGLGGAVYSMSAPLPPAAPSAAGLQPHDELYSLHQTELQLRSHTGKAFEMDTTEDSTESQSLYQDSHRAFGVKSPTSELARLEHRQSHNVQLMKASLYADTEMEDDASVSTGDQMVPRGTSLLSAPARAHSPSAPHTDGDNMGEDVASVRAEEMPMKPLLVRPHTIVLKYHRKVPPFKKTIAGRLNAACIADMSVCRARHSRVGLGPSSVMVYPTAYHAVTHLPHNAELCDLSRYVGGRGSDDWSSQVVVRLALGQPDNKTAFLETLTQHLDTLLEYSEFVPGAGECPRLALMTSPRARRDALKQLMSHYKKHTHRPVRFGVSSSYCQEVFELCEALWGADLENDGIPGTDEASIVDRHKKLLEWLTAAVDDVTEEDLKKPTAPEPEDESDAHSGRVWALLIGGRVLEACRACVKHGDTNMAALIAQCAGNQAFRSLIARQISIWRECGADTLISTHRLAILHLLAGLRSPRELLAQTDWLRAFHATARFLCPQVPSLEQIVTTYESLFSNDETEDLDLTTVDQDDMGMKLPLPPYLADYDVMLLNNGKQRRILDLRYELIRARAMNSRPRLQPAAYTPDPMDYTLCFLLGTWFTTPSAESCVGVASQLEAAGAWYRALQVLQYHPVDSARDHLIRNMLSRTAPSRATSPEQEAQLNLLTRLRIPNKWLLTAQAHRAKYERLPMLEVEHLIGAEQWNAAHKVLLEELLPEAVLADDLKSIAPLLDKLHSAASRHEVSGWQGGGQALHHYIHVCQEIRGLVSSAEAGQDRSGVSGRLEALRPRVAAACRALARLAARSPTHCAARTEMGARLLQLALAAGEPAHHLALLLKTLNLPPDCTAHAQHKITSELAERAADMCIASPASSPPPPPPAPAPAPAHAVRG